MTPQNFPIPNFSVHQQPPSIIIPQKVIPIKPAKVHSHSFSTDLIKSDKLLAENCPVLSSDELEMSLSKESLLQWTMEEEEALYKSEIFYHDDLPTSPDSDKNIIRSNMIRSLNESIKCESLNPIIGNRKGRSEPLSNTTFSITKLNPDTKPSDWLSPFPMPNESNDEDIILEIPLEK